MKIRYITPVVAAVAVLAASGAMAASTAGNAIQTKASAPAQVRMASTGTAAEHASGSSQVLYQNSTIATIPANGEVRLRGKVTDTATAGSFMLKDSSGSIKIEEPQNSRLSLKDDAEVTVYGRVMGTGTDRYIAAHRVVTAQALHPAASATHSTITTKN